MKVHDKVFIGGQWRKPQGQNSIEVINATTETLMENISLAALMLREAFSEPLTNNTIESSAPISTDNNAAGS